MLNAMFQGFNFSSSIYFPIKSDPSVILENPTQENK